MNRLNENNKKRNVLTETNVIMLTYAAFRILEDL